MKQSLEDLQVKLDANEKYNDWKECIAQVTAR